MKNQFNSPQEEFWSGEFGDNYIGRNESEELLSANIAFFARIFSAIGEMPKTFLELGANVGMNIKAIRALAPRVEFTAIEINKRACEALKRTGCKVIESSVINTELNETFEFVFSKGVLIHLSPDQLPATYEKMYKWSSKFILIAEYYNPTPTELLYRGNQGKLFKRDFAGEFLELFPNLTLRDYGFSYHRGLHPQDDITWFLLEKDCSK
jgi:pseudaminic acid biosynthesis-associated methylase